CWMNASSAASNMASRRSNFSSEFRDRTLVRPCF
ncbi:MAG: hypothetical protein ACI81F_002454, partial [Thalassolituus oleivorans]